MATLPEMFQTATEELGNLSAMWNPFAIIEAKGLDGHPVFSSILPRIIVFGIGLLVLFSLLRVIHFFSEAISGRSRPVMGLAAEIVLAAALLVSYPEWVQIFPHVFVALGRGIQEASVQDLSAQVAGSLAQMGDERASDFRLWSVQAFQLGIGSLIAALTSTVALVLLWVMAKLQAYLFTFWYLLGPIALPTMVFPPLRHVSRIWLGTLLGVSFMAVTGPLLFAILTRSQWLPHAFAAGAAMDAVTCMVFSILCIVTSVSIPILSQKIWNGIEAQVFKGAALASEGIGQTAGALYTGGSRARETYDSLKGGRAASQGGSGSTESPKEKAG